jgi:hypothetical protein
MTPTLPAQNATITAIASRATTPDWDHAGGVAPPRWQGRADAYVAEETVGAIAGERLDVRTITTLVVPLLDVGDLVQVRDTLTYEHAGATHVRAVRETRSNTLAGTVRLWLEDA